MKKSVLVLVLLFTICYSLFAAVTGMGGLVVASVTGGQSLWLNPAGLTPIDVGVNSGKSEIASSLSLGKIYDVKMSDIGILIPEFSSALNLGRGNTVGVGYLQTAYTGTMIDDFGFDTSVLFRALSIGYSHRFGDWLSLGAGIRPYWALQSGDENYFYGEGSKIKGTVMFDTGLILTLNTDTDTRFGFSVFNLTRPKIYNLIAPVLPTTFIAGLSNKIWDCLTYEVTYSIADYKIAERLDSSQVNLGLDWFIAEWLSVYGGVGQVVDSTYRDWNGAVGVECGLWTNDYGLLTIGYDCNYLQETLWTHTLSVFYRFGEGVEVEAGQNKHWRQKPSASRRPKPQKKEYDW